MIIIFPTETCYGIGCSVFDLEGIRKIKKLKRREEGKCMPVVVHDMGQWKKVAILNDTAVKLAKAFWPGPLTLVTKKHASVPDEVCKDKIGCRVSPNKEVMKLTGELGPMVATSANLSGGPNPYSVDEVPKEIRRKADEVIDSGRISGKPSTIYDCLTYEILREGPVPLEEIMRALARAKSF